VKGVVQLFPGITHPYSVRVSQELHEKARRGGESRNALAEDSGPIEEGSTKITVGDRKGKKKQKIRWCPQSFLQTVPGRQDGTSTKLFRNSERKKNNPSR